MRNNPLWCAIAVLVFTMPTAAMAVPITYMASLTTLNSSGVTGSAALVFDDMDTSSLTDDTLAVTIDATGLEVGPAHAQHIHGVSNSAGEPINSTSPTLAQDDDGDGFVELAEGLATYGAVIVPLDPFPSTSTGAIDFTETYLLSGTDTFAPGFTRDDLFPLAFREIVLHGLTVDGSVGAGTPGEVEGTAGYKAVLPVASGEIFLVSSVPEPSTIWLLLIGLTATAMGLRGAPRRFRA